MSYHIYGIGNALVDKEFEVDDAFFARTGIEKGLMTLIDAEQLETNLARLNADYGLKKRASGGSAANTIIAAAYFGAKAYYTCSVANDETGDFFVADIKAAGVDTNMDGERDDGVTGKCLVMVTPDAERTMNTYLGISTELRDHHVDEAALAQSQYAYLEGYLVTSDTSRQAAIAVRDLARKHGVKVAMTFSDPAMVQFFKDGLVEMLGDGIDLLFCNEQEAKLFSGETSTEAALAAMQQVAKHVVVTCGAEGALIWDGDNTHRIEPNPVTAVDSNGAGDMFAGAYLYAISQGHDAAAAGRLASLASATVVSQFGPRLSAEQHAPLKQVL